MFSYYGSKSKIVDYYPKPKHGKIIEPFAGSARYSLKYFENDVLLVDKYEVVVKIWKWLQQCSISDIMGLPELSHKQSLDDFDLSAEEKLFLGFFVARGVASPQKTVQQFNDISVSKKQVANNLFKIKHWDIRLGSYEYLENEKATWFIDPPYQKKGYKYVHSKIDFNHLSKWSMDRLGQVLVCENIDANWLPFKKICDFIGSKQTNTEAIWSNEKTNYDITQTELFAA